MRASIPLLFMLMLCVLDALEKSKRKKDWKIFAGLIILAGIGSITPVHEMVRSVKETTDRINNEQQIYETSVDFHTLLNAPNFSGATDESFFFKYIAK